MKSNLSMSIVGVMGMLFSQTPVGAAEPQMIAGQMPGDCQATIGLQYPLASAVIVPPQASAAEKQLHGTNQWQAEGEVTADAEGLLLKGAVKPAWASPILWSGLKDVEVKARMKIGNAKEDAVFGIKFGGVWAIAAGGPRLCLTPAGTASFPVVGEKAAAQAKVKVPLDEWFTVTANYAYDSGVFTATLNGQEALKVPMPRQPFGDFMDKFGRPAPLAGLGVFAEGVDLRLGEFSFLAGAPRRRIVIVGDSITQRAFWVAELEKALGEKVTNLGIGGDTAKLAKLRFDRDALPLKPEICVLFLGSNDMGGSSPQGVALSSLAPMAGKCKAAGITPVLCELLPRRGCKNVAAYNAEIHKLAQTVGAPVLAWHDATLDPAKGEMKEGFAPDGTHPVQAGAEAMIKAIDLSLLKKPSAVNKP